MKKLIYGILILFFTNSIFSQDSPEIKSPPALLEQKSGKYEIETNRAGLYSPKGVKALVYIPAGTSKIPLPLVVYFHGNSGGKENAYQAESVPVQKFCEEKKCILLSVQNLWGIDTNTRDTSTAIRDTLDATADMIGFLIKNKIIDPEKVYATGASAGGFVSWSAAIYIPELVKAIGDFKGNYYADVATQLEGLGRDRRDFLKLGDSRTAKDVKAYLCIGGKSESKRILEQLPLAKKYLEEKGSPVTLEEFPKEGHGLSSGCLNGFWKMVAEVKQ